MLKALFKRLLGIITNLEGGLRIKKTEDINAAFLTKQGWKNAT